MNIYGAVLQGLEIKFKALFNLIEGRENKCAESKNIKVENQSFSYSIYLLVHRALG